jgi:hypothetical protein
MERLVTSFGADKNTTDPTRAMRLPGFANWKCQGRPMVRCIGATKARFTKAEILMAFPPLIPNPPSEF